MNDIAKDKATIVILAAGMGSRYGGLKQIDPIGPSGETVIDYSVFDAVRAGFDKVVFVIRRDFEHDFRNLFVRRFEQHMEVVCVLQDLADIPHGFATPPERSKPWGTGHAVWACRNAVAEPFAVINADDFYGRRTYELLADALAGHRAAETYTLVGFVLRNTLSRHGPVSRGICSVRDGLVEGIVERTGIEQRDGNIGYMDGEIWRGLPGDTTVSMNTWAFGTSLFDHIENAMTAFLRRTGPDALSELYLPVVVDDLIRRKRVQVQVVRSNETWLGVTYPQDKPHVAAGIQPLVMAGIYPSRLWE